jgi:hypothetical protein
MGKMRTLIHRKPPETPMSCQRSIRLKHRSLQAG